MPPLGRLVYFFPFLHRTILKSTNNRLIRIDILCTGDSLLPDVPFRFEENESSSTPQTHTPFLNERLQRESILVLDTRQLRTIGYIPFHDCFLYTQTDFGNSGSSGRRCSRERPLLPSRPSTHHAINLNRHVLPSPAHWDIRKQTVQLQPSSCPPQSAERSVSTTNTSIHKTPQKTNYFGEIRRHQRTHRQQELLQKAADVSFRQFISAVHYQFHSELPAGRHHGVQYHIP